MSIGCDVGCGPLRLGVGVARRLTMVAAGTPGWERSFAGEGRKAVAERGVRCTSELRREVLHFCVPYYLFNPTAPLR